ncbi:MAG TPA: YdcF family protein [Saccharospirillum sp.]|nr:YdcF family protein [Saccharospirillum sp.]
MILRYFLKTLALPPMISILVALLAILLWRRRPVLARTLAVVSLASLWLFSSPVVSTSLMRSLEAHYPVLSEAQRETTEAEAIVILAGGIDDSAPEFGFPVSLDHTLLRLRYGAFLHRETGLPILVSGGSVFGDDATTLAAAMANELDFSFQVETRWLEERSRTTRENADFSAALLEEAGIDHILLVTEGFHMPRSVRVFEQTGLTVTAAPTAMTRYFGAPWMGWLPSSLALHQSSLALHEYLGMLAYRWL